MKNVAARGTAVPATRHAANLAAGSLNRGRSGLLALVVPLDVPYFTELAAHVVDRAEERGYTVLIDRTAGMAERERQIMMLERVEGDKSPPAQLAAPWRLVIDESTRG